MKYGCHAHREQDEWAPDERGVPEDANAVLDTGEAGGDQDGFLACGNGEDAQLLIGVSAFGWDVDRLPALGRRELVRGQQRLDSVGGSGRGGDRAVLIQHLNLDAGCGDDVGRPDPGHASRRDGLTSLDRLGIERSDQGGALQHEEQDRAGDHGERE